MCNQLAKGSQVAVAALLLPLMLLLGCISNGAAIKCFVCDSSDNPSCSDLKSNSSIVPEECGLDKIKSLGTWLFELNTFSYFDNGANKNPLMNCQKVMARDQKKQELITSRFCQLDTGDSDACEILRSKLHHIYEGEEQNDQQQQQQQQQHRRNSYGPDNNAGQPSSVDAAMEDFFCEICKTDRCNAAPNIRPMQAAQLLLLLLLGRRLRC